jgi:hypothetical protein
VRPDPPPPRPPENRPTRGIRSDKPPMLPEGQRIPRPDRPQVHTAGIRPDAELHGRPGYSRPTRGATIEIPPVRGGVVEDFDKKK